MAPTRRPAGGNRPRDTRPKRIKDPVHDLILVEPYARALLDEPAVQRLRFIRQTGTAHLVYPGANHTRFEHSLGAHHLAMVASGALRLPEPEARLLGAGALLHDVGHGPFSHLSERVVERATGRSHEDHSVARILGELAGTLETHDVDPKEVARLITGDHALRGLVSGPLDVDRIDYLLRDGHYTGMATSVDAGRLMTTLTLHDGQVVLRREGLAAAEALLVTRFSMHAAVYFHKTCRAAELLLEHAMDRLVEGGEVSGEVLATLDDADVVALLRRHPGEAGRMARRVFERRLTKVAFEVPYRQLEARWVQATTGNHRRLGEIEDQIAGGASVPAHHVQVDLPAPPGLPEVDAPILGEDGEVVMLSEASTLVRALSEAHVDHWHFRVYAPPESREAVARAAPKVVGLERPLDEF